MLEVRNIVVLYGKNYAVHGVSLEVKEGEIISLIGANGSGKSTMLAAIAGLARCSAGEIQFQGKDITNLGCHETVAMGIGYVPEGRHLFQAMSVMENLLLGAQFPRNRKTFKQNLQRAFGHFPILATRKKQLAGTLSGGEAQMLAIARGLMTDPRLLLLDEPSFGLAPLIIQELGAAMMAMNREGRTILLAEQNAHLALGIANRAYLLEVGKVVLEGLATDMRSKERVVRAYLGG
jgi:branched-chain amino acid transport system ATP-binding protein